MTANDLRNKSKNELNEMIVEILRERLNLKLQRTTGQTIKTHRLSATKKEIARIKTIINEQKAAL